MNPGLRRPHRSPARRRAAAVLAALVFAASAPLARSALAAEATVAVATNFTHPSEALETLFAAHTGHQLRLSSGSTGQLYAQIVNGAPYDVFLAADQRRPRLLEERGLAVRGSRLTYAIGALTLWSPDAARVGGAGPALLRRGEFRHLAIANPELAPYGLAARQVLQALGLWEALAPKLVRGENIAQAFQYVATGNAELGFVALSQVLSPRNPTPGSRWDVPRSLHAPIRQDAVLLARGRDNAAAGAFLEFLRSPKAAALIRSFGYDSAGAAER